MNLERVWDAVGPPILQCFLLVFLVIIYLFKTIFLNNIYIITSYQLHDI